MNTYYVLNSSGNPLTNQITVSGTGTGFALQSVANGFATHAVTSSSASASGGDTVISFTLGLRQNIPINPESDDPPPIGDPSVFHFTFAGSPTPSPVQAKVEAQQS